MLTHFSSNLNWKFFFISPSWKEKYYNIIWTNSLRPFLILVAVFLTLAWKNFVTVSTLISRQLLYTHTFRGWGLEEETFPDLQRSKPREPLVIQGVVERVKSHLFLISLTLSEMLSPLEPNSKLWPTFLQDTLYFPVWSKPTEDLSAVDQATMF